MITLERDASHSRDLGFFSSKQYICMNLFVFIFSKQNTILWFVQKQFVHDVLADIFSNKEPKTFMNSTGSLVALQSGQ